MSLESFAVITTNFASIGLLPRLFFRQDGRKGAQWWLTAAPLFIGYLLQAAVFAGLLTPLPLGGRALATGIAIPLSITSTALIAFTIGTHRIPLALWHQDNDQPREIVTWGAYRRIRHPFYTSFLLALTAGILLAPHPATAAALVYGAAAMTLTARREERRLLASEFGAEYAAYAARAGRFVPGIGRLPA